MQRGEQEQRTALDKRTQAIDMLGPEGPGLSDGFRTAVRLVDLEPNGQVASQQAEADGNPIGMKPIAHQMIEIMAVELLFDGLLGSPALTVRLRQELGGRPA